MKNRSLSFLLLIALAGCQTTSRFSPPEPITLSDSARIHFEKYKTVNQPLTFAATADGRGVYFTYCPVGSDCYYGDFTSTTIRKCEERTGRKCYVYAQDGKLVHKTNLEENRDKENSAMFSLTAFGGGDKTAYNGRIFEPKNSGEFIVKTGNSGKCTGRYNLTRGLSILLKCDDDAAKGELKKGTYKGIEKNFSWVNGGYLLLKKSSDSSTLEMEIFPYKGTVTNTIIHKNTTAIQASIQNSPKTTSKLPQVPVVIKWIKNDKLIRGQILYSNNSGSGLIKLESNNTSVTCSGNWKFSDGSYDNGGKVRGVWAVSCSDGRTVTGDYQSDEKGTGSGVGFDSKGEKVTIRFGKLAIRELCNAAMNQNTAQWKKALTYKNVIEDIKNAGMSEEFCRKLLNLSSVKLKRENNETLNNNQGVNSLKRYENKCSELGFKIKTEKFGECVLKLMDSISSLSSINEQSVLASNHTSNIRKVFKKGSKVCVWTDKNGNSGTDYFYKDKSRFSGSADRVIGDKMLQGTWQITGNAINLNWYGGKKGKGRWYKVERTGKKSFSLTTSDRKEFYKVRCK